MLSWQRNEGVVWDTHIDSKSVLAPTSEPEALPSDTT